jgi:uncharacterized protein YbjT (DUF2867 family)
MTILIIGGTGMIGSAVAAQFRAIGAPYQILTRHPLPFRTDHVGGDLRDQSSLRRALVGIRRVVMVTPSDPAERELGEQVAAAIHGTAVERFVYVTMPRIPALRHLPHIAAKSAVCEALMQTGVPLIELQPNMLMQVDGEYLATIMAGVFPLPLGVKGVHRVDARDVADAVQRAVFDEGIFGGSFRVDGAECVGGFECAALWSQALGRKVRYIGDDLEQFRARISGKMTAWQIEDALGLYACIQNGELTTSSADQAQTLAMLGHPPRRYHDYISDLADAWWDGRLRRSAG